MQGFDFRSYVKDHSVIFRMIGAAVPNSFHSNVPPPENQRISPEFDGWKMIHFLQKMVPFQGHIPSFSEGGLSSHFEFLGWNLPPSTNPKVAIFVLEGNPSTNNHRFACPPPQKKTEQGTVSVRKTHRNTEQSNCINTLLILLYQNQKTNNKTMGEMA